MGKGAFLVERKLGTETCHPSGICVKGTQRAQGSCVQEMSNTVGVHVSVPWGIESWILPYPHRLKSLGHDREIPLPQAVFISIR